MIVRCRKDVLLLAAFIFTCCNIIVIVSGAGWSKWTAWRPCTVTCGKGEQHRYRSCEHTNAGNECRGKYKQTRECNAEVECPVDGGWSEWSDWSACSVSCGEGVIQRNRVCDNPEPKANGQPCQGSGQQSQSCFDMKDCGLGAKWSPWGVWSPCSATCGNEGIMTRTRVCNNPADDGQPCDGSPHGQQACKADIECPVNGQWSGWSEWSDCSVTCGSGEKRRWRGCDQPAPKFGGADCDRTEAAEVQEISCENPHCPVNGGWSDWSEWGDCYKANCSSTKDLAYMMQQRSCDSPPPSGEGAMCQGIFINASICFKPINCKVDGGWSNWSEWKCERHVVIRSRKCDNPPPSNNGEPCKATGKLDNVEFHAKGTEFFRVQCPNSDEEDEDNIPEPEPAGSGMGNDHDEEYED